VKRFFLLLALALPLSVAPFSGGCNLQGEGQLCSPLNVDVDGITNLDCQTGLSCRAPNGGQSGVCCADSSVDPACLSSNTTSSNPTTSSSSSASSSSGSSGGGMGGTGGTGGTGGGGATDGGTGDGG
jgi:uncharacterized membrane protein YgcG